MELLNFLPLEWLHRACLTKPNHCGLGLCEDYEALHIATMKNRYPLHHDSETLARFCGAWISTKLNFQTNKDLVQIEKANGHTTACSSPYGQSMYGATPFGLINKSATFQAYIELFSWSYIDNFTVRYLEDTLIDSANNLEQEDQLRKVLEQLREYDLDS